MKRAALALRGLGLRSPRYAEGGGIAAGAVATANSNPNCFWDRKRRSGSAGGGCSKSERGVIEQTTQTIIQEQRKITMVEFQKAEESREKAEKQRGIADRAYRESLGLTAPEFVDLRRIEVQKEIVQHSPSALTVIMGLERVGINLPPFGGDK